MDRINRQRPKVSLPEADSATGLVLSVRGKWAVVMAKGGSMVRVRVPFSGAQPGDVIVIPRWAHRGGVSPARRLVKAAVASLTVLALILAGMSAAMFLRPLPALAMISVDINPGFSLGINSLLRVVSIQASDAEAELLIRELHPGRRTLSEVLHDLVDLVGQTAAAPSSLFVLVGAAPLPGQADLPTGLSEGIHKAVTKTQEALGTPDLPTGAPGIEVAVVFLPDRVAEAARQAGVSLGRYAVMLALAEVGADDDHIGNLVSGTVLGALREAGIGSEEVAGRLGAPGQLKKLLEDHGDVVDQAAASARAPDAGPGRPDSPPGLDIAPGPPGRPPGDQEQPGDDPAGGKGSVFPVIEGGAPEARGRALEVLERLEEVLGRRPGARGQGP